VSEDDATTTSMVDLNWVDDDLFIGSDAEGHSIVFDSGIRKPSSSASPSKAARPRGIGPMNALLTSLGACSGMDVAAILLKRKQRLSSLKVEVSGRRPRYGHPKPFTEIHMRYLVGGQALEDHYVKEAVTDSVTKFCSVVATIGGEAKISFSYEIVPA
jgi:putative redox protein